jgi:hypothetical protein
VSETVVEIAQENTRSFREDTDREKSVFGAIQQEGAGRSRRVGGYHFRTDPEIKRDEIKGE